MALNMNEFKRMINERNIRLGLQAKTREDKVNDGLRGKKIDGWRHGETDSRNDAGERVGFGVRGNPGNREAVEEERQDPLCPDRGSREGNLLGGVDNGVAKAKRSPRVRDRVAKKTLATA
jgi:hypothetical protein